MKKNHSMYLVVGFSLLVLAMLAGLVNQVVPAFPEHAGSMVIGTLAYVAMAVLVLTAKLENKHIATASGIAGVAFIATHIFASMNLFTTVGVTEVTHSFGYAAVGAFVLAAIVFGMKKVKENNTVMLGVSGLMSTGVFFTYYHVAAMAAVRSSILFFVPFTVLFAWTIGQFAVQVAEVVKARKQVA